MAGGDGTGWQGAGEDAPAEVDSEGRKYDSPVTAWRWWMGPVAILVALLLTVLAQFIVDIPASATGVDVTAKKLPGALVIIYTVLQDAIFVATAAYLARGGRRAVSALLGLRPTPKWRAAGLVIVTLLGFLLFSVLWAALLESHEKEKLLEQLGAGEGLGLLLGSAALTCVVAPICEEVLFRGFVFTALRNLKGPWPAAVITGLLFGAVHSTSAPAVDLVPLAALGFGLCLLYRATGSLYPCIAVHAFNNSLAFGQLEGWGWQIPVLLAGSFAAILLLVSAARTLGLISPAPPAGSADAVVQGAAGGR